MRNTSERPTLWTVGEVASLAHVSVRTLHHYDEIGLVRPSARSDAGYRLYDAADLGRLQQVRFYRELGFGLDEIRTLMTEPGFDRGAALREQRELLRAEGRRVEAMLAAIDVAITAHETGSTMTDQEMFEVFGETFDHRDHTDEVRDRWGDTDAYQQSQQRTRGYAKADWQAVKDEMDTIHGRFAALLDAGQPAGSPEAMEAAEAHRRHIDDRFYDCSHEMQVQLAEMYVADPRFTATYEAIRPGLAGYVREAILANADRAGGSAQA